MGVRAHGFHSLNWLIYPAILLHQYLHSFGALAFTIPSTTRPIHKSYTSTYTTTMQNHYLSSSSTSLSASQLQNTSNNYKNHNKIFCYGDSLTAGTAPPSYEEYPYARDLELKLNSLPVSGDDQVQVEYGENYTSQNQKCIVRHSGLPGWTAAQLASPEGNLISILDRIKSSTGTYPSIVIILAGTNDLAYCTNESQCNEIFHSIQRIHGICHDRQIDTVALSIPPSAWQNQSNNDSAKYAKLINDEIQHWTIETKQKVVLNEVLGDRQPIADYVSFPITSYDPSSGFWSSDGLHFSPEGYKFIGESLALPIKEIIKSKSEC